MTMTTANGAEAAAVAPDADEVASFASLGVPRELVDVLAAAGITRPFPIQAITIPDGLAGRDVCGKAKTGAGKTLAFGIPLVVRTPDGASRRPRSLVLVPTRELAVQVADVIIPLAEAAGCRLVTVYGGAPLDAQVRAIERGVEVIVATPGRLIDLVDRKAVDLADVGLVVLDEADRMVDMGFLPQVEWLLRHIGGPHQTLLFSATLDGAIDHVVRTYLRDPVRTEVASHTITVEEMAHRFLLVHEMDKAKVLAAIAQANGRTLAFVRSKRGADRLSSELRTLGVRSAAIHGDLHQRAREKALADFTAGRLSVLVATDVAARGLDIDDIDVVVHYDPADDHKSYLHRSGRTARAGEAGVVVTLLLWNEELEVRRLQKRLGLTTPIVSVFSNDARLADLAGWEPLAAEAVGAR